MPVIPVINERLWLKMRGELAHPHRVVVTGPARTVAMEEKRVRAVPAVKVRAPGEGTIMVPVAELLDAAPLSAAERDAYDQLDRDLAGTMGDRGALRAFFGLLHRAALYGEAAPAEQVAA
jgi:hypothetical protein